MRGKIVRTIQASGGSTLADARHKPPSQWSRFFRFSKCNRLESPRPPYEVHAPLREILDPPLQACELSKTMLYCLFIISGELCPGQLCELLIRYYVVFSRLSDRQNEEMDYLNLFIDYHYKSIVSII